MTRGRRAICPWCGGKNTVSKGYRKTTTLGVRRIRRCKDCKRRFTSGTKSDKPIPVKAPEQTPIDL